MMSQSLKPKLGGIQEYKSTGNEANCNALRADHNSRAGVPHPVHVYGVPCNSFYGGCNSMGYQEAERYPSGYQGNVPTITLTSHRIQFGCQQNQVPTPYCGQRLEEPGYIPHYHVMRHGKHWPETSMEHHPNSNAKPANRGRTTYTDDQIAELEGVFNSNPYPTNQMRQQLAFKIDVPEGKVKIWFQNRRARAKKFKLGCGGGGPWRSQHGDSRGTGDQSNQNNNNTNSGCNKSLSEKTFAINTLLPLPTKPAISSSLNSSWSCAPTLQQKSASGFHANHSCGAHGGGHASGVSIAPKYSLDPMPGTSVSETKPWNWGSQATMPSHTVYRPDHSMEHCQHSITEAPQRPPHDPPGSHGNVPDLITQTSKVGLQDSHPTQLDDELKSSSPKEEDETKLSAPEQQQDVSTSVAEISTAAFHQPADISDVAQPSAPVMTANSSCLLSHYHEMRTQKSSADLLSPPPIRRLVFPFHTLGGSKMSRADFGMQGYLSYPPAPPKMDAYGRTYCSGALASQPFMQHGTDYPGTSQTYPGISLPEIREGRGMFVECKEPMNRGICDPDLLAYKSCQVAAVSDHYQGDPGWRLNSSSQSDHIQDDDEVDDGDATDDAIDDVEGMEGEKPGERAYGSTFEYPTGKMTTNCWSSRGGNIMIKTTNFDEGEGVQEKCDDRRVDEKQLPANGITVSAESTSGWASQLMTGIYPPVSTPMVG